MIRPCMSGYFNTNLDRALLGFSHALFFVASRLGGMQLRRIE